MNIIAGKKSILDQQSEQLLGRSMYQNMKKRERRIAANQVSLNPGSWSRTFLQLTQKQLLTYLWDSAKNHGERERARRAAEGLHTDYKYALSEIRRKKDRRLCVCPFHFQHEQEICQDHQCSDAVCNGEPLEIRTPDPLIKSQMLCLLS